MVDGLSTVTFHLAEDETRIYDRLCRHENYDRDQFRSGRRVDAPLFHIVDLWAAFVMIGADMTAANRDDGSVESISESVREWDDVAGGLLEKTRANIENQHGDPGVDFFREMIVSDPRFDPDGPMPPG